MKVLVCDPLAPEAVEKMRKAGLEVVEKKLTPEELIKSIGDYDAVSVRSATKITKEVIEAGVKGKLRLIGRGGVGLDNIDVEAAKKNNVKVVNTPAASSVSVAELALTQMLSISRMIHFADSTMKAGKWEKKGLTGVELFKKTLGVVGFGRIGREVAKRAKAFDMTILAYDVVDIKDAAAQMGAKVATLDEIFKNCDYITLHMPLTPTTKHMINGDTLKQMKKGVYIINCARGGIVDEKALAEALKAGHVAGAAMDVFENEPIEAGNPLVGLQNVILSPHIGASTHDGQFRVGTELADLFCEILLGKK